MSVTHERCEITVYEDAGQLVERHECQRCPHGILKGIERCLYGDAEADARTLRDSLHALDTARCEDHHPELAGTAA